MYSRIQEYLLTPASKTTLAKANLALFSKNELSITSGNTLLHELINELSNNNSPDISAIKRFLEKTDLNIIASMSKTTNNNGQLPIDLIETLSFDKKAKTELASLLLPFTLKNSYKRLGELIDVDKILIQHDYPQETKIYQNLKIACIVANETRQAIKESPSHPEVNSWDWQKRKILCTKLDNMRGRVSFTKFFLDAPINYLLDTQNSLMEALASAPLQSGVGNCAEFTFVAWHFLRKKNPKIKASCFYVENGDHVFLVIGDKGNAVICDAWAGEVYPYLDMDSKLTCHRTFADSSSLNMTTHFNPKYHFSHPDFSLTLRGQLFKLLTYDIRVTFLLVMVGMCFLRPFLLEEYTTTPRPL